eukprot:1715535-Amphidinium_carterae.1
MVGRGIWQQQQTCASTGPSVYARVRARSRLCVCVCELFQDKTPTTMRRWSRESLLHLRCEAFFKRQVGSLTMHEKNKRPQRLWPFWRS